MADIAPATIVVPEAGDHRTSPAHGTMGKFPNLRTSTTSTTRLTTTTTTYGSVEEVVVVLGRTSRTTVSLALLEDLMATAAIAPLRATAESRGSGDFSPLWSGQNVSGCREIPAAQITRDLAGKR